MSETSKLPREIFNEAVEIEDAQQRADYLVSACGNDVALRRQVEALIQSHHDAGGFLGSHHEGPALVGVHETDQQRCAECGSEVPQGLFPGLCPICALRAKTEERKAPDCAEILPTGKPGEFIGRYKLLQQIGEGGCGVVFMAEQEEPIRRKVAVKVIKLGMDTKSVIARFEAERQALALMDHPNIAKVLDAGATDTGRPYFVMELVRGVRITHYCDQQKLTTRARLDLFMQVCHAIQHAHQKGIIHRDIKPSNILVTLHDGVPVPKVIDFGIAKATSDQRLTDKTLFTAFEQFMGTPAYMSPEQAEMSGLDIDTRSDIYALGVLLYELLTGKTPFDAKELLASGLDEMRRTIREVEPKRPSTRLSTMQAPDLRIVAQHRQTNARNLTSLIDGDLDWIVMKALEKDRRRRYETANGFAEDIKRYLAQEPVVAGAPTVRYRLGKWVRRNKLPMSVGAVMACLAIGLVVSLYLLFKEFQGGKFGAISVNSRPEGAEIWQKGELIGRTPYQVARLLPGEFSYMLVLSNYVPVTNATVIVSKVRISDLTFLQKVEPLTNQKPTDLIGDRNFEGDAVKTNLGPRTGEGSRVPGLNRIPGISRVSTNSVRPSAVSEIIKTNLFVPVLPPGTASIAEMTGAVDVRRQARPHWMRAETGMIVSAGDQVRTGNRSRAVLRMSNGTSFRISENSVLKIPGVATNPLKEAPLELKQGSMYLFPRDGSTNRIRILTTGAIGGVEG